MSAASRDLLDRQRELLRRRIAGCMDFLIGSVATKGPKRPGFNLTFKVDGVTRSRHIRKDNLERVRRMVERHRKLKELLQQLSDLNWQILNQAEED